MTEDEIRREQIVAKAYARAAELRQAVHDATKGQAPTTSRRAAAPAPSSITRGWQDYIRDQLDRRDRAILRAVAVAVIDEERARVQEIATLRDQVASLERDLAELKGRETDRRLRAVPSTPTSAMIA
jgi:hypothetical protein